MAVSHGPSREERRGRRHHRRVSRQVRHRGDFAAARRGRQQRARARRDCRHLERARWQSAGGETAPVARRRSMASLVLRATLAIAAMAAASSAAAQAVDPAATVVCASNAGERQVCTGNTSAGVALVKSTGASACLLGKTWGYDDAGVWVADGCSGEFQLGQLAVADAVAPPPKYEPVETWGEFNPGSGFLVGRSELGELSISAYALVRYLNQMPA